MTEADRCSFADGVRQNEAKGKRGGNQQSGRQHTVAEPRTRSVSTRWQAKPTRKRTEPLAEDRRAAILALRRQGKTGLEIYGELRVETERERQQIRRFLQRQVRREPGQALLNSPMLTDEIVAAKSGTKAQAGYGRCEDYYPLEYWAKKWNSPATPDIARVAQLLEEAQPIAEIVLCIGLKRGRVKRIRAALWDGGRWPGCSPPLPSFSMTFHRTRLLGEAKRFPGPAVCQASGGGNRVS